MIPFKALSEIAMALKIPMVGVIPAAEMPQPVMLLKMREAKNNLSGFEPAWENSGSPQRILPGARSIIAIGLPYDLKPLSTDHPNDISEISAVSWGYDYHDKVREKLFGLTNWLESLGHFHSEVFCDTGPLNDRYIAYLAGLGTYGRNQMLIHPEYGSAVVLGYLVTDAEIESSQIEEISPRSLCGSCRLCQVVCPAGALKGDYEIEIQRCISNLTQQKRPLSLEESKLIGHRLYGCDLCQTVCPRNPEKAPEGALRADSANRINPFQLFQLDVITFKTLYSHHGFAWRGLKTLQRNAFYNILNSGKPELVSKLKILACKGQLPESVILLAADHGLLDACLEESDSEKG
jgi:epoxyqueuosine reductase